MKSFRLALALPLLVLVGCVHPIVAPTSGPLLARSERFAHDYDAFDWTHHTEADFWQAYPEYVAGYDAEVDSLERAQ